MEERGSAAGGVLLKMTDAPTLRGHRGTAWSSTGKIGFGCTRKGEKQSLLISTLQALAVEIGSKLFHGTTSKGSKTKITLMPIKAEEEWTPRKINKKADANGE